MNRTKPNHTKRNESNRGAVNADVVVVVAVLVAAFGGGSAILHCCTWQLSLRETFPIAARLLAWKLILVQRER